MSLTNFLQQPLAVSVILHLALVCAVGARVVMQQRAPGVALAWLFLVVILPLVGAFLYLLIGERRIGPRRSRRISSLFHEKRNRVDERLCRDACDVDWKRHPRTAAGVDRLGRKLTGSFTVPGNTIELHSDSEEMLQSITRDVEHAESSVLMAFYIWNAGGSADDVLDALIRAAGRGVCCRVLVDGIGARPWLKGSQPHRLREAGVEVREAVPVGLLLSLVGRDDMRLHRKIVVIDNDIAWTGSMNMVDPRLFKQDAGVGEWVDAMARLRGPAVPLLATTMLSDWALETGSSIEDLVKSASLQPAEPSGHADVQVVPSGPGETGDGLLQMLLALINAAEKELVLTTPYLVPDDSMLRALRGAAARGVRVAMILPERVDSILTRHASRSYYEELLEAGVEIYLYEKGLLHTKSIAVDETMSMFGTVNLDMRSLWINYELSLFVFDPGFARSLHALQETYLADSRRIDPSEWSDRSTGRRLIENSLRLFGPLL